MTGTLTQAESKQLCAWLAARLDDADSVTIGGSTTPSGGGASAETLLLDVEITGEGGVRSEALVLRRQVKQADLFLRPDLERQFRTMAALSGAVPTPEVIGFEADEAVIGGPFLVMRRVEGRAVPQKPPYNLQGWLHDLPPEARGQVWENAITAMAGLHGVDWREGYDFLATGQGDPGLGAFLDETEAWFRWAADGRDQPVAEAALAHLRANAPRGLAAAVLWGDATPANILVDGDHRISALLDWEMAALGPGEIDLGWWMFFDRFYSEGLGLTRLEGLPTRSQTLEIYEKAAGRKVQDIAYFELLAMLRLSIVAVRQFDRQVAKGSLPAGSRAYCDNPITVFMAQALGLPEPQVGDEFAALLKASTSHQ